MLTLPPLSPTRRGAGECQDPLPPPIMELATIAPATAKNSRLDTRTFPFYAQGMGKFCNCGRMACPICKGKPASAILLDSATKAEMLGAREATSGGGTTPLGGQAKRGRGRRSEPPVSENVGLTPTAQNANVRVAPSSRAGPIEVRRNPVKLEVEGDGAIAVDCACGCGRKVYLKPAYYSTACRSRAWRKRHE